jgi:hypothetical protein
VRWAHRRWELAVEAFVDGELPRGRLEEVDRHLRTCRDCGGTALVLLAVRSALQRNATRARRAGGGGVGTRHVQGKDHDKGLGSPTNR